MKTEFVAGNSEGSILRMMVEEKQVHFFRDPWGRDSSSTPDEVFPLTAELATDANFQRILKLYTTPEQELILQWCK